MDEIVQWLSGSLGKLGNFLSTDLRTLIALVLFFLSYQLFRLVIVGMVQRNEPPEIGRVAILILPGVLMSLTGIVLVGNLESVAPIIFYVALTLAVGYGLVHLGYRLFDKAVFRGASEQSVWENPMDLILRAAPGTALALFGALIVIISLSQGFSMVGEISALAQDSQKKMLALMDARLQEGLKLLTEYLRQLPNPGG